MACVHQDKKSLQGQSVTSTFLISTLSSAGYTFRRTGFEPRASLGVNVSYIKFKNKKLSRLIPRKLNRQPKSQKVFLPKFGEPISVSEGIVCSGR